MSFDIQDGIFVTPWAVFIGRKAYDLTTLQEIKGLTRQNYIEGTRSFGKLSQHMTSNIGMNLPWVSKYFDVYFAISADNDNQLYMYYLEENQLKQINIGSYCFPFYEDEGGIYLLNAKANDRSIFKYVRSNEQAVINYSREKFARVNVATLPDISDVSDCTNNNIVSFLGVVDNKAYFFLKGIRYYSRNSVYYDAYCIEQLDLVSGTVTQIYQRVNSLGNNSEAKCFRDEFSFIDGCNVYIPVRYNIDYSIIKYTLGSKSLTLSENQYITINTRKFENCYNNLDVTYIDKGGNALNINKDKNGKEYFTAISVNSENPEVLTSALGEFICWASDKNAPIFNEYKVHQCIKVDNDTFFIGNGRLIKYLKWNAVKGNWEVINTFDVGELYSYFALDFTNKLWVVSTSNKVYRIVPAQGVNLSATFEKDNYNYLGVPINSNVSLKCSDINGQRLTIEQTVKLNGPVVFEDGTKEKLVQFHENEEITIPVIVNGHGSMSCSFAF